MGHNEPIIRQRSMDLRNMCEELNEKRYWKNIYEDETIDNGETLKDIEVCKEWIPNQLYPLILIMCGVSHICLACGRSFFNKDINEQPVWLSMRGKSCTFCRKSWSVCSGCKIDAELFDAYGTQEEERFVCHNKFCQQRAKKKSKLSANLEGAACCLPTQPIQIHTFLMDPEIDVHDGLR